MDPTAQHNSLILHPTFIEKNTQRFSSKVSNRSTRLVYL